MVSYDGKVLTAFSNAGPYGHRIHESSDGSNLGGGAPSYPMVPLLLRIWSSMMVGC